jgi:hypothetical protein
LLVMPVNASFTMSCGLRWTCENIWFTIFKKISKIMHVFQVINH